MKHIVIAANPYRDSGLQKALTVYRMLTEHGHQVIVSPVEFQQGIAPLMAPVCQFLYIGAGKVMFGHIALQLLHLFLGGVNQHQVAFAGLA